MEAADWIELRSDALDAPAAIAFVTAPHSGGVNVFLGTTRAAISAGGSALVALDYEAYESMALQQMRDLAGRARSQWPHIARVAILHRTGRVEVGEASVIVAVSAPHRAGAFDACRWIIDALKAETAIWKREVWDDGSGTWVHPEPR